MSAPDRANHPTRKAPNASRAQERTDVCTTCGYSHDEVRSMSNKDDQFKAASAIIERHFSA